MYKLCPINPRTQTHDTVWKMENGVPVLGVPFDPANTDYQAYLKWLEEGNTPEPADE